MQTIPAPADGARLDFAGRDDVRRLPAPRRDPRRAAPPLGRATTSFSSSSSTRPRELWMKLALHELLAARERVRGGDLAPAAKMLSRVARIMAQLNQSWDVLATLTPAEYSVVPSALGSASGFQSWQYRMIEFALGAKNAVMMEPHRHRPDLLAPLARRSTASPRSTTRRSGCSRAAASPCTRAPPSATGPSPTASTNPSARPGCRSIARPPRTGTSTSSRRSWSTSRTPSASGASGTRPRWSASSAGSAAPAAPPGVGYLRKALDAVLFPELWRARTAL